MPKEPMRTQGKTSKLPKVRENADDQVVLINSSGFNFASDWLREWCVFSGPIIGRTKQEQSNPGFLSKLN